MRRCGQPLRRRRPDPCGRLTVVEAVILCGGLGQRLRPGLADRPKPLAMVAGRPFLEWLILAVKSAGLQRIVLATGYPGGAIQPAVGEGRPWAGQLTYLREPRT